MLSSISFCRVLLASCALAMIALPAHAASTIALKAKLFGHQSLKGSADFIEKTGPTGPYRLDVRINQGSPFETHDVSINGEFVGQITTNPAGAGRLRLIHVQNSLSIGDTISVGPLTGVFHDASAQPAPRYDLRRTLINDVGVRYTVRYREQFRSGVVDRRFDVTISDAEPGQSVPIFVRGVFIAPMLPDDNGYAEFGLRTNAFINGDDSYEPMHISFPSLVEGEEVQVGSSFLPLIRH